MKLKPNEIQELLDFESKHIPKFGRKTKIKKVRDPYVDGKAKKSKRKKGKTK